MEFLLSQYSLCADGADSPPPINISFSLSNNDSIFATAPFHLSVFPIRFGVVIVWIAHVFSFAHVNPCTAHSSSIRFGEIVVANKSMDALASVGAIEVHTQHESTDSTDDYNLRSLNVAFVRRSRIETADYDQTRCLDGQQ